MVKCGCYSDTCKFCKPDGVDMVALVNGIEPGLGDMMETDFRDARTEIARRDDDEELRRALEHERKKDAKQACRTVEWYVYDCLCGHGYDKQSLGDIIARGPGFFNFKYKTLCSLIKELLLTNRDFQDAVKSIYDQRIQAHVYKFVRRTNKFPILDLVCSIVARETTLFRR
jgi:hypothetical protein